MNDPDALAMLIAYIAGFALCAVAWHTVHHMPPRSPERSDSYVIGLPKNSRVTLPVNFITGYEAGDWFKNSGPSDAEVLTVWPQMMKTRELGTPHEQQYAIGWMLAVLPIYDAAMGYDQASVRKQQA